MARMPRLDQIVEHLFANPSAELVLESNTTGLYRQPQRPDLPVFRQLLRTGQILLLFADVVPKDESQALLAGQAVQFRYAALCGPLDVHMELKGPDIKVLVRAIEEERAATTPALPALPAAPAGPSSPALAAPELPPAQALARLIAELPERRATHLHLAPGQPAFVRVDGALVALPAPGPLSVSELREALASLVTGPHHDAVLKAPRFAFSWVTGASLFHVRAHQSRAGLAVVVRALPAQVPTPASLGIPADLVDGLSGGGLWVIAAAPGHGASTSLAALAQRLLFARAAAVCTLEAPVEYVLSRGLGMAQQLEIGTHAPSWADALAQARTLDADLTVIAELDHPAVLAEAVGLADRGRLVLGAVHAPTALDAAEKLLTTLGSRPLHGQLAGALRGVFAQRLVANTAGGRSLAWELLPANDVVRGHLREGQVGPLALCRSTTLEASLRDLVLRGELEGEVALAHAADRAWLEGELQQAAPHRAA